MFSPLEQFDIIALTIPFSELSVMYVSNSSIIVLVSLIGFLFTVSISWENNSIISSRVQHMGQSLSTLIKNLIGEVLGFLQGYYTFIYTLFVFLSLSNFFGMLPYVFTTTSHLIVTLTLSGIGFLSLNILGGVSHGWNLFSLFLPGGTPFVIIPFIIGIELISYLARLFSVAIRLFANLMSGHALLKILAGLAWGFAISNFLLLAFLTLLSVIILVVGLEIAIAGIQAYVFTILSAIYINDVIHLH